MRPVRLPEDLAVIDDLLAACRLADGHAAVGEHKYLSLLSGSGAKAAFVEEEDERVVSYLHLSENADAGGWTFESAVHPGFRTVDRLQAVVEQAIEEATERGGVTLRTWIYNATWPASLAALGFHADRELRQLRIRLPVPEPEYPPQIRIAPFRPGIDEEAWLVSTTRRLRATLRTDRGHRRSWPIDKPKRGGILPESSWRGMTQHSTASAGQRTTVMGWGRSTSLRCGRMPREWDSDAP